MVEPPFNGGGNKFVMLRVCYIKACYNILFKYCLLYWGLFHQGSAVILKSTIAIKKLQEGGHKNLTYVIIFLWPFVVIKIHIG